MDRQAQLEAMMRQYMASQQNRGAVSDAEMQMMAPQQGMGQMTDADMAIQQNQQSIKTRSSSKLTCFTRTKCSNTAPSVQCHRSKTWAR
jgi:hypothetical protein